MNRFLYIIVISLSLICVSGYGQTNSHKGKKAKQVNIKIKSTVVDQQGKPIGNVVVSGNEGRTVVFTNNNGEFSMTVPENSFILLESLGYEDKAFNVKTKSLGTSITLEQLPLYMESKNRIELPSGFSTTRRESVGAISTVSGADLLPYSDLVLDNALTGKLSGLNVIQKEGSLGKNLPDLIIRGYGSLSNHGAVVLVDGIERTIDGLLAEEIESVSVLKDATAKILYGPRAANGVIMVTTKRGESHKRVIQISADYGVMLPVAMPKFLNSHQYASLYNEACENDGLAPFYSQKDLDGYASSTGQNDLRYPDVDYHDYFLKKSGSYRKITTQFFGGNKNVRYALIAGYMGGNGLEKVGKTPVMDRFNIRGNLDVDITESLKVSMDIAGRIELNNTNYTLSGGALNAMSTHRPNEYPFLIEGEGIDHGLYGETIFGGSLAYPNNLYADLQYGGFRSDRYFAGQTNLGLDLDMKKVVKGLRAKAYITLDNYSYLSKGQNLNDATYAPLWTKNPDGSESMTLLELATRKFQGDVDVLGTDNNYNMGYFGALYYDKSIAKHQMNFGLSYNYMRKEMPGTKQDIKNSNLVLKGNYNFANKYLLEATVAMMGSSRFEKGNRQQFFPAVGMGWVLSEESWGQKMKGVDYLKLRASFGILGYDGTTPSYLYEQRWSNKGDIGFGNPNDDTTVSTVGSSYAASPGLGWEKSREINVGIDALLLKRRLSVSIDLFDNLRYDIIQQVRSNYPATAGHVLPYQNWGKVASHGFEVAANWSERAGELAYTVGLSASYATSKVKRKDEIPHTGANAHRATVGQPVDGIYGYVSNGLFEQGFNRGDYPTQTLGYYTAGDLRYADLNNDGIIDDLDRTRIGNSLARTILSAQVNLNYKGFGLYVLGTANLGFDQQLTNTYYRNSGSTKYSEKALDRWHPVNNPNASYPRLTTTTAANNSALSDFWIEDGSFFRLKNVELSYTFTNKSLNPTVSKFKVYVRGTNLWCISKIKDLDAEVVDAGVKTYPVFTNIVGGVSVTF